MYLKMLLFIPKLIYFFNQLPAQNVLNVVKKAAGSWEKILAKLMIKGDFRAETQYVSILKGVRDGHYELENKVCKNPKV